MSEYIVRETDCGLATKQDVVGELVRCKDCLYWDDSVGDPICMMNNYVHTEADDYCSSGLIYPKGNN